MTVLKKYVKSGIMNNMWMNNKKPIIALAPMADFTDQPFCKLCREVANTPPVPPLLGGRHSEFVIFREMVSAEAIVRGNEKTLKMCEFDKVERPIVLQLFGSDPSVIVEAAEIIIGQHPPCSPLVRGETLRPDGIDINMGCPVPKITKKGLAGASLLKDHDRAMAIVKGLKSANLGVPVSVKTRLGWAKDDEILEFAPKLEKAGADLITIHGRTKKQGYSGVANWDRIAEVKKLVSIPVIANGDIVSGEDVEECLRVTGADGVMIGRGALGNPWVLRSGYSDNPDLQIIKDVVLWHAQLHLERYGEENGLVTFRKHLLYYFKGFPGVKEIRQRLVCVETMRDLKKILNKY